MREVDSNLFCIWEDELPSPQDLMPLSQSLITPDLALAFNIPNPNNHHTPPPPPHTPPSHSSAEFDSPEAGGGAGGLDEQARTLKRPRLVWTPQLHKRFVDAVAHLGIKNAVPKTIMQLMSVDGLTRENVASHLQKYRLYLKRMSSNGGGGGNSPSAGVDAAMDRLFASSPVPPQFLHPSRSNSEHFMPFVPAQQHHPTPTVAVGPPHSQSQIQQQFRHFGNSPPNGQFEHHYLMRQPQMQILRSSSGSGSMAQPVYVDDLESPSTTNGKKILSLFPSR